MAFIFSEGGRSCRRSWGVCSGSGDGWGSGRTLAGVPWRLLSPVTPWEPCISPQAVGPDGLLNCPCPPDFPPSPTYWCCPGVPSRKTLTLGFALLVSGQRTVWVHPPFCPVLGTTEVSPFDLARKVTGRKWGAPGRSCVTWVADSCLALAASAHAAPPRSCAKRSPGGSLWGLGKATAPALALRVVVFIRACKCVRTGSTAAASFVGCTSAGPQ